MYTYQHDQGLSGSISTPEKYGGDVISSPTAIFPYQHHFNKPYSSAFDIASWLIVM